MSDSLIAFQPAIEEPSNMVPSLRKSSSTIIRSKVTCCHLPLGSVKRTSTYLTSFSLISLRMSAAVVAFLSAMGSIFPSTVDADGLDGVHAGFAGADADCFLDIEYENLAVANA